MAFNDMAGGGADCSSGQNPMAQMLKQFGQDRSLQRDRFAGPAGSSQGPSSMRTTRQEMARGQGDQFVNEFFGQEQQTRAGPAMAPLGGAFQFTELQRELDAVRQHGAVKGGGDWSKEFDTMQQLHNGPQLWEVTPEEEAAMERAFEDSKTAAEREMNPSVWRDEFMNHPEVAHMNPHQRAEFEQAFEKHFDWANEFSLQAKGKGRMDNNATWEEQFAAYDPKETDEDIAKKIEAAAAAQDPAMFDQFEDIWQGIRDQLGEPTGLEDGDDWEDEFGAMNNSSRQVYKPELGDYEFEVVNPYLQHPDPMAEGLRLMEQGASLNEIALAFEAVVQKDASNSTAWMHLGNTQAQNEKEEPAIRALEQAVKTDSKNLSALMSLAVSYTNESYDQAAYQSLEQWIAGRYPQLADGSPTAQTNAFELHERVTNLFLEAARQAPAGQSMDSDVQVGLGVLFYGSGDLDKATDCFTAALKGRPDDYLLWNRLGATLANNGRSEEAIDAYHRALELRPSFVRARYNLGVSCINIGCYKEAAEHLLTGLAMHKRGDEENEEGVNVSSNLWEMLRKTFIMMDRKDLAAKATTGTDISQFRDEFEF